MYDGISLYVDVSTNFHNFFFTISAKCLSGCKEVRKSGEFLFNFCYCNHLINFFAKGTIIRVSPNMHSILITNILRYFYLIINNIFF